MANTKIAPRKKTSAQKKKKSAQKKKPKKPAQRRCVVTKNRRTGYRNPKNVQALREYHACARDENRGGGCRKTQR